MFEFGPIQIRDLDLEFDLDEGKLEVDKGRLISDQITMNLTGDMALDDELGRSRMRFKLVLSELGDQIAPFASFMNRAKWDDEKYHYSVSCRVSRLSGRCFRPERQRSARGLAGSKPSRSGRVDEDEDEDIGSLDEARERRREERAERRKNRAGSARRPGDDPDDDRPDDFESDRDGEPDRDEEERDRDGFGDEMREEDHVMDRNELPALDPVQPALDELQQPDELTQGDELDFE